MTPSLNSLGSAAAPGAVGRRRGRPVDREFAVAEVAYLCAVPVERVLRVLGREDWRFLFFPGARLSEPKGENPTNLREDWWIPERDLRRLIGGSLADPPVLFTVRRFAELMSWSVPWTYEQVHKGLVKHRKILGALRIPASEYWEVSELRPAEAAGDRVSARLSFFARKRASGSEEGLG